MIESSRKKPIDSIEFIRAVCAVGILVYHFLGRSNSHIKFLLEFKNGQMGATYVTIFFLISGLVLYYNYPKVESLKVFYFKRAKSIYPMFWIAYLYFFIEGVFQTGDLFYQGRPWTLIFSLFGIDGYVYSKIVTYAYIGEWFLGALIILYVLYPLFSAAFNKSTAISSVVVILLYIGMMRTLWFTQYPIRNIIACALSFCLGIVIMKYKTVILDKRWGLYISVPVFLVLSFVKLTPTVSEDFLTQLYGYSLFFILYHCGNVLMRVKPIACVCNELGALSYPFFLLQHHVVNKMTLYQNPSGMLGTIVVIFITIMLTTLYSKALSVLGKAFVKSKPFKEIEKRIMP